MASCGTFQKLSPLSLLEHLSSCYDSAHLKVYSKSVSWSIYLEQGKIIYASHSIEPFDRLDCHLRRLSHQIPTLGSETRTQLRLLFETEVESQSHQNLDYQAICWLVKRQYLNPLQAAILIKGLVKEVIESFLLVKEGNYELGEKTDLIDEFCKLELQPIVETCQKQLQGWKALGGRIWSPYQRPYFVNQNGSQQLPSEIKQKLSAILKGFSFRHLAILLNQDELQLAQSLHPYITAETILLDDPQQPFDQLPKFDHSLDHILPSEILSSNPQQGEVAGNQFYNSKQPPQNGVLDNTTSLAKSSSNAQLPKISTHPSHTPAQEARQSGKEQRFVPPSSQTSNELLSKIPTPVTKSTYKIVCVDDSPVMLREISYFLNDDNFTVVTINDSVRALMQIIRHKPDLILLDVNMSGINGYELCRLLRNHSLFKSKPIIMVTANTGIIDRVKARLGGASGYLTKPFTQADLLKMIFRHLF